MQKVAYDFKKIIKLANLPAFSAYQQFLALSAIFSFIFYNVFQPTKRHPPSSLRWDKGS
jgi:hypothetical protein